MKLLNGEFTHEINEENESFVRWNFLFLFSLFMELYIVWSFISWFIKSIFFPYILLSTN